MVSSISFTSTFKVNNKNQDAFSKFYEYALDKESEKGVKTILKDKFIKRDNFGNYDYKAEQTLIVPDDMDADVETFCANNGIYFKKYNTKDLLNPESIAKRIACAPKGHKKVNVDVKKLEELAKNQVSNLNHCRKDYDNCYRDSVDTMLKSGDEIPATTLVVQDPSGNEDLKRYVDRFGIERLNNEQIFTYFNQYTNDPDHCVYFALKDMGIDKIPVYVDKESYEAGKILGLLEDIV